MLVPKIKIDDFRKFISSPEIVAVAAAIIITPLIQGAVENLIGSVPFLKDHITIALILSAFVVFIIAAKVGGIFRAVLIGIAGGLLITAIEPFISDVIGGK